MEGGGERLSQLHARLQQEAEKIRQWKTSTEMDLKQKDAKLQEAVHTVDTQRRTLVELQVCVCRGEGGREGGKSELEGMSAGVSYCLYSPFFSGMASQPSTSQFVVT